MVNQSLKIQNMNNLSRAFRLSRMIMGEELRRGIKMATLLVEGESRKNTPVDTGRLRASHRTEFKDSGIGFTGVVSTNTEYDIFVHQGTRFMKGRPYMRKALQSKDRQIDVILADSIQRAFNRIAVMT